jgi:hypothetical protein
MSGDIVPLAIIKAFAPNLWSKVEDLIGESVVMGLYV